MQPGCDPKPVSPSAPSAGVVDFARGFRLPACSGLSAPRSEQSEGPRLVLQFCGLMATSILALRSAMRGLPSLYRPVCAVIRFEKERSRERERNREIERERGRET